MTIKQNCILKIKKLIIKFAELPTKFTNPIRPKKKSFLPELRATVIFYSKNQIELDEISDIKSILCKVKINKNKPTEAVETSITKDQYSHKSLILVDDVLHSGTTLIYGVKHFLETPLKQFKTAVLVNRNHKKYPVKADFKGISLSTSINEQVNVIFKGNSAKVVLV